MNQRVESNHEHHHNDIKVETTRPKPGLVKAIGKHQGVRAVVVIDEDSSSSAAQDVAQRTCREALMVRSGAQDEGGDE